MTRAQTQADLVYDVGLHHGEDTALYLAKGYRVVAFEAHPDHIARCRERFAAELADGRLRIVEGAITDQPVDEITFYVHESNSEWGTTESTWADRNAAFGASRAITVPSIDMAAVLEELGTPHYMKVDIEGADTACVEALRVTGARPVYVSLESTKLGYADAVSELELLESLGYDRFALVQQATLSGRTVRSRTLDGRELDYTLELAASGDFGDGLRRWMSAAGARRQQLRIQLAHRLVGDSGLLRGLPGGHRVLERLACLVPFAMPGWWDLHGELNPELR